MRRPLLMFALLFLAGPIAPLAAQSGAQAILPQSVSGWAGSGTVTVSQPSMAELQKLNLPNAGKLAAVVAEYEFQRAQQQPYQRGGDSLLVRVYCMKDPTGGYGLYSFLRTADMPRADFTEHSSMSDGRALILTGNLVLDVTGRDLRGHEDMLRGLVAAVTPFAKTGPYPSLWQHLPVTDFVPRSDKYFLGPTALDDFLPASNGDWLGFSQGAEAELARYRIHGREVTLLVADYPDPQIAKLRLAAIDRLLDANDTNAKPSYYTRRDLTLVALVANARSQEEANVLLDQIHSNLALTWNEPAFSLTDPNIGTIVVGIIIGTGILCMFAIIAGIAFGGVRLLVKWLLPGKVFDRATQLQILQLGLSSKPILADDFYSFAKMPKSES
jgi:hypothetical protein